LFLILDVFVLKVSFVLQSGKYQLGISCEKWIINAYSQEGEEYPNKIKGRKIN